MNEQEQAPPSIDGLIREHAVRLTTSANYFKALAESLSKRKGDYRAEQYANSAYWSFHENFLELYGFTSLYLPKNLEYSIQTIRKNLDSPEPNNPGKLFSSFDCYMKYLTKSGILNFQLGMEKEMQLMRDGDADGYV